MHAGGTHRQSWSDTQEEEVLIPLNTTVVAPGFADLYRRMLTLSEDELLSIAAQGSQESLQLKPLV